ncbi:4-hydroxythreonine-4-phosphate dehydrogenase 2 [Clostridium homopropionicum DSM 5847]|uniref:Putative D-threonate 4-phosphate dehydrogenase n=1 Tax=Clostridium homopropionicum DSM 5847 TaxID=1121318 RepID=A0A0L6Z657_9CLOT|nr:4-hydroxythreonine-4-phosphate dehydrogenase PdxA [Clostridium homopropionicum]KOA18450.1 4-hydroxythreonine-4-phosphate dehydrogenase 2 [Clostridium homopropionicum DSM 5847]SFF66583.1 4-hydroxythreonine-4-phosphate dehydrogenase [Clostridium homopropionicum]
MNRFPILGITMGDPCGIGPEITVKALSNKEIYATCHPLVVGSAKVVEEAIKICESNLKVNIISDVAEAKFIYGTVDVLNQDTVDIASFVRGKVSEMGGKAAYEAIAKVIDLAMQNKIDATITGPLNKEALNLAGYHYSGHTEIYAKLTNTKDYTMMLADGNLRVVHVSTHVSLREACNRCTKERVFKVIKLAEEACKNLGILKPRVAVAGLNPHSGENGLFGTEEIDEIIPAILKAKSIGIDVDGPIPPDTIFSKAQGGIYDIVVAMYHDQGHIPVKLLGFQYDNKTNKWNAVSGVNITLGLPIIRSSVDHGTAFDQAGKGSANEESLINAINYGTLLAK